MSNDPSLPETLNEMFEKMTPLGPIATLIQKTLKAVLQPGENVLLSFYQLEMSEQQYGEPGDKPKLGSCDIKLVSNERFLSLGFYPSYHQIQAKAVHTISNFDLMNRFSTGYEGEGDPTTAEERGFNPLEMQLTVQFTDVQGQTVAEWQQEAARPDDIKNLYKLIPTFSKLVGKPLTQFKG